jgi:hypothetical protein
MSELYGQDEAISQLNSRNEFVRNYNQGVGDFNNNIMNSYTKAKGDEATQDDLTYAKDVINNVMSAGGFKAAFDNRKYEINKAKNIASEVANKTVGAVGEMKKQTRMGGDLIEGDKPGVFVQSQIYGDTTTPATVGGKDIFDEGGEPDTAPVPQPAPVPPATEVTPGEPQDADAPIKSVAEEEANGEGHGIISHAINKISKGAVGLDMAENVTKVGGAVVSAGMGGVDLVGDIQNMVDNKGDPFKKGASWEDDVNNVGQIAQGVSDVVGVIPGMEWVAGLGNIIGGLSSVVGLFGDHRKNEQNDKNVEGLKGQLKDTLAAPSSQGAVVSAGNVGSTAQQGLQTTTQASF